MVAKSLNTFGPRQLLGYDIGCAFAKTISTSSLGLSFEEQKCRCIVNAFHGYSHNYLCQLQNHPNGVEGMGIEDLETLERVFSQSNALAPITRYMTAHRRRVFIDLYFQQWDTDKYQQLGTMLYSNYRQALGIIKTNTIDIAHVLALKNLDEAVLVQFIADERDYFQNVLGKESEGDLHAMAYVELLEELRIIEYVLRFPEYTLLTLILSARHDDASALFRTQTPHDYHFISPERSYSQGLSDTRRADTARRQLAEHRDRIIHEIIQMEDKMNIYSRWTPLSPEYQATLKFMSNRKYQKVLDHLQQLVIKRLFELHKLNLSQTG